MYEFRIDRGIPLPPQPPARRYGKGKTFYVENLKVGDSFIYPGHMYGARSLIWQYRARLGYEFAIAKTKYGNVRVWRIK